MDRKAYWIKQCQGYIAQHDEHMDYQSKVLREQALAFIERYSSIEQLASTITRHWRK